MKKGIWKLWSGDGVCAFVLPGACSQGLWGHRRRVDMYLHTRQGLCAHNHMPHTSALNFTYMWKRMNSYPYLLFHFTIAVFLFVPFHIWAPFFDSEKCGSCYTSCISLLHPGIHRNWLYDGLPRPLQNTNLPSKVQNVFKVHPSATPPHPVPWQGH